MALDLTDRERRILEATIQTYIETAEPAGSHVVSRRSALGVSPATVRNVMSDLEAKGYLYQPHASGGRIPTDLGYRVYVDRLMQSSAAPIPSPRERDHLARELHGTRTAFEEILRRAAQVLGVLTRELGVAATPALAGSVLDRLDLVRVASDRLLLVFHLQRGVVRSIFVHLPVMVADGAIGHVARILNERLGGLTLAEIRTTLSARLRDVDRDGQGRELLNIFIAEGEEIFDLPEEPEAIHLGSATHLAVQPEFATNERMRDLLELTERRDLLRDALHPRRERGLCITIGAENDDQRWNGLTLVTSSYHVGDVSGVIGVLGPTRMPYQKIIGLVEHTSRLVEGLLE